VTAPPFGTLLIANRGEIAVRIARACRELGIRTVAACSTPDLDSMVADLADQTVHIGPAAARRSYRNAAALMEAAKITGADAVHPGYGFLSEDPDFAEICELHGLTFIGPPPEVIAATGDKSLARKLMAEAGLPVLPGSRQAVTDAAEALEIAAGIGYPLIIKAAAGGGGRGMSVVRHPDQFPAAIAAAATQAQAVFGDPRLYLERFLEPARHVEIQVLADRHGAVVHLGERECSVQRRRQKLIEETPASRLPAEVLARMGEAAVRGARAIDYVGVGTFEFLVDDQDDFYFMEVNCRIQVEHPVTEMVTGIDLVHEQILVAAGCSLPFAQQDIRPAGVAIECRVNVEDPARDFLPTPGRITELRLPSGPFVRVDTHCQAGVVIPPEYDPLLAKVIVWAPDRAQALRRMARALDEVRISGDLVRHNVSFLREVLADPLFQAGEHDTALIDRMLSGRARERVA
jgi:acetyl-CoA carboxylase biotin carboxylase subunit